jgi:hypothetical protein
MQREHDAGVGASLGGMTNGAAMIAPGGDHRVPVPAHRYRDDPGNGASDANRRVWAQVCGPLAVAAIARSNVSTMRSTSPRVITSGGDKVIVLLYRFPPPDRPTINPLSRQKSTIAWI